MGMNDPRIYRDPGMAANTDQSIQGPLAVDPRTRKLSLSLAQTGPFYITDRGELAIRTEGGLIVSPGTPYALRPNTDGSLVLDNQRRLTARPKASQVVNDTNAEGGPQTSLRDVLNMLFASAGDTQVAIGALPVGTGAGTVAAGNDSRIVALGIKAAEKVGTAVLVGGTVVVAATLVTASSVFFLTHQTFGGTPGLLNVSARTAGVGFTITSANALDTSTVGYVFFEPF
jgi:hypothetical protein